MGDRTSSVERSALMARIRSQNTRPEMIVRSLVHRLGYRFVPNDRRLPGSPDLVFVSRRRVIFVHGCFWHSHTCGRGFRPSTSAAFWEGKLRGNVARDRRVQSELESRGWSCLTLHECELSAPVIDAAMWRIIEFLER